MNFEILLAAIAIVESNNNDNAVGKAGERSRYQIMEYTWYKHSTMQFETFACHDPIAKLVAENELRDIVMSLHRARVDIDILSISACWNAGVTGYLKHHRGGEYARKVKLQYDKLYETNSKILRSK